MVQPPMAMAHLGEGIWSQSVLMAGAILREICACEDHDVGLSRTGAKDARANAVEVKAGRACGHHFYGATGQAECEGPQGSGPCVV